MSPARVATPSTSKTPTPSTYTIFFSGSFNPIHLGHLALATSVLELSEVEKIVFLPLNRNPFGLDLAPAKNRLKLLELALVNNPNFSIETCALNDQNACLTHYQVLFRYQKLHPKESLALLIGSDLLPNLDLWPDSTLLQDNFPLWIVPRPDFPLDSPLSSNMKVLDLPDNPAFSISAGQVATALTKKQPLDNLLPAAIIPYFTAK